MALVKLKNQTELAFISWMDEFPESFHWCDMNRFYTFIKTTIRYRSLKWHEYAYFKGRVLGRNPKFALDSIERLYEIMKICITYDKEHTIGLNEFTDIPKSGYQQKGVKNGKIYVIDITQQDYLKGGVNISE